MGFHARAQEVLACAYYYHAHALRSADRLYSRLCGGAFYLHAILDQAMGATMPLMRFERLK